MRRAAALLLVLVACSDDGVDPDSGTDANVADTGSDAVSDVADTFDAHDIVVCPAAPDVRVAGTSETNALADAPARCGQAEYQWRRDPGALVAHTPLTNYPLAVAVAALESFGVTIEEPPHRVATTTITYETQERGRAIEATALVASPTTLDPGTDVDVVLMLHGTTGFADGCGASHALEYQAISALFAAYGYVVVLPDYIGLAAEVSGVETGFMHPFHVAEPTAHASLDAVRAALRLDPQQRGELCANPRVAVLGVSQGGHAALWVNRLARYYARELDVVGTVAVVPPASLIRQMERGLGERVPLTPLSLPIFVAHAQWYDYEDELGTLFQPPFDEDVAELVATCDPDTSLLPDDLSLLFTEEARAAAEAGNLGEFGNVGCSLTIADPTRTDVDALDASPVLFLTGELDDVVWTALERESFPILCGSAFEGRYLECADADHVEPIVFGLPEILTFIEDRFAGEEFVGDCSVPAPQRCMGTP